MKLIHNEYLNYNLPPPAQSVRQNTGISKEQNKIKHQKRNHKLLSKIIIPTVILMILAISGCMVMQQNFRKHHTDIDIEQFITSFNHQIHQYGICNGLYGDSFQISKALQESKGNHSYQYQYINDIMGSELYLKYLFETSDKGKIKKAVFKIATIDGTLTEENSKLKVAKELSEYLIIASSDDINSPEDALHNVWNKMEKAYFEDGREYIRFVYHDILYYACYQYNMFFFVAEYL